MPKELDFDNLRFCLDNYNPSFLFIRLVGSMGGTVKVREQLKGRELDFVKNDSGLYMLVDSNEVFHFPLRVYDEGFSVAYERIGTYEDGSPRMIYLSTGIDPDDPELPEPRKTTLITDLDDHLMKIDFKGKIPLKFHSWWMEPYWKYWTVKG